MHLGETLLPWNSKDKKCCLYKTSYAAAPVRVLGDFITKFSALHATNFRRTYKNQKFFLIHKQHISEETRLVISRLLRVFSKKRSTN
jgi:hypothetical protein